MGNEKIIGLCFFIIGGLSLTASILSFFNYLRYLEFIFSFYGSTYRDISLILYLISFLYIICIFLLGYLFAKESQPINQQNLKIGVLFFVIGVLFILSIILQLLMMLIAMELYGISFDLSSPFFYIWVFRVLMLFVSGSLLTIGGVIYITEKLSLTTGKLTVGASFLILGALRIIFEIIWLSLNPWFLEWIPRWEYSALFSYTLYTFIIPFLEIIIGFAFIKESLVRRSSIEQIKANE